MMCTLSSPPCCPLQAGITISGINAEVMPGQWEFQIGEMLELSRRPLRSSLAGRCGAMSAYNPSW